MEIILIIYMMFSLFILKGTEVFVKQIMWYLIGFVFYFIFKKIKKEKILNLSIYAYVILNLLLLYLLFFGKSVNGAKAWINLGFISFQPSEFMKVILIILLSIFKDKKTYFLVLLTLIPSVLTFLEPDTGNVVFYVLILFIILFLKSPKLFIKPGIIFVAIASLFIGLYFFNQNLFTSIFGTSFFYRFDRVVSLFSNSSYQLNEALKEMGAASVRGSNFSIAVPASFTDFAFSRIAIKSGMLGAYLFLLFNMLVNYYLISKIKYQDGILKIVTIAFLVLKIIQEMIHILMNIGYAPIMGITLPFISYGGSSIISYMIILGFINNCSNKDNLEMDYSKLV